MSQTVYKYPIRVTDEQTIQMPKNASTLYVAAPDDVPCIWALVNPDNEPEQRTIHVHGTGHPVPDGRVHRGSFMLYDGAFVGHVFEPSA